MIVAKGIVMYYLCEDTPVIIHMCDTCFALFQLPRQSAHNQTTKLHTDRTG